MKDGSGTQGFSRPHIRGQLEDAERTRRYFQRVWVGWGEEAELCEFIFGDPAIYRRCGPKGSKHLSSKAVSEWLTFGMKGTKRRQMLLQNFSAAQSEDLKAALRERVSWQTEP